MEKKTVRIRRGFLRVFWVRTKKKKSAKDRGFCSCSIDGCTGRWVDWVPQWLSSCWQKCKLIIKTVRAEQIPVRDRFARRRRPSCWGFIMTIYMFIWRLLDYRQRRWAPHPPLKSCPVVPIYSWPSEQSGGSCKGCNFLIDPNWYVIIMHFALSVVTIGLQCLIEVSRGLPTSGHLLYHLRFPCSLILIAHPCVCKSQVDH